MEESSRTLVHSLRKRKNVNISAEISKSILKAYPDKVVLEQFIRAHLLILNADEQRVIILKYCRLTGFKNIAFETGFSERWCKTLHQMALDKSAPLIYSLFLKAISASLEDHVL